MIWVVFVLFLLTVFSNSSTVNMKYNDAKNQFLIMLRVYKKYGFLINSFPTRLTDIILNPESLHDVRARDTNQ